MMVFWDLIFAGAMTLTAIILLWITTRIMLIKKRIISFIPFLVCSILLALSSFFSFYGIFTPSLWFFLELPWFILVAWIILNLWRENE